MGVSGWAPAFAGVTTAFEKISAPYAARGAGASLCASLKASGVMTCVMMKAMGQAVMKLRGQWGRKSGPAEMKPMMPDMESAIPKVMKSWARKRVFCAWWFRRKMD